MSKDKYPSKFSPQMEAIVFIILQIFFATRAVLKIGEYFTLVYTKTVDSVKRARWLARQTPNILHYLPPSNSRKMASQFASVESEEITQN